LVELLSITFKCFIWSDTTSINNLSIIGKNSLNHIKVSNYNQSNFSIKITNPWTHMIVMLCRFNIMLTCYNVKIITFT